MSASQIAKSLGMNTVTGRLKKTFWTLLEDRIIERTEKKINSRLQKYRLTEKGKSAWRKRIETAQASSPFDSTNAAINDPLDAAINDGINETINETIKSHPGISRAALIEISGKSRATVARVVSELIQDRRIEHRGSKKTGGYYVIEKG